MLYALAKATHYTLYLLLGVVIVTGIVNASYRGFNLFGVWSVPQFGTGDAATRRSINEWHEWAAIEHRACKTRDTTARCRPRAAEEGQR